MRTCPTMRGIYAPHVVMSVIAYISTFVKLCMDITWCYRLTNIIIEAYLHVHYDYVFIKNIYDNECPIYKLCQHSLFKQE